MRYVIYTALLLAMIIKSVAQVTQRPRPSEWNRLVHGARFMDRILPMPSDGVLGSNSWGSPNVQPRYIDNGIETSQWSYWGGNIKLGEDGKYHLFVCGWPENSEGGHRVWPNSIVFNTVSDNSFGPFLVKDTIGKGHNPEVFRLTDGRYVLYVIDGYYLSEGINGPWSYHQFEFLERDRDIIEGLSNLTFAQRADGSYLMVCRGGGIWFSQSGLSPYNHVTQSSVYPKVEGYFEDPVVWRDHIQYNLIVNDWLGRIAFYLRSKNGVDWKVEAGEAYMPGIAKHENGLVEGWHKLERMKVFQDKYGRATQANFAVIDVEKEFDKGSDNHSSKNIVVPLTKGLLLNVLNKRRINTSRTTIRVRVAAEAGFNPVSDIDFSSLRFGSPDTVNYGGGSKLLRKKASGDNLTLFFEGQDNFFPEDEFAGKLLGKTTNGELLFGYARLPGISYQDPILSARLPELHQEGDRISLLTTVENFGEVTSKVAKLKLLLKNGVGEDIIGIADIPKLKPFEKIVVTLLTDLKLESGVEYEIITVLESGNLKPIRFGGKIKL